MSISDETNSAWITAFNDVAEKLLGVSAQQLIELRMKNANFLPIWEMQFTKAMFKPYIFRVRAAKDMQGDEVKIKYTAVDAKPIDYITESALLINNIEQCDPNVYQAQSM